MKYIFVIPRMGGGGAERVLANQANEFVANGHDVTIMTIVGGESFYDLSEKVKYISANVKINRKSKITSMFSQRFGFFKARAFFKKMIITESPDIVFSQQRQADIICYSIKGAKVKFKHICYEINDPFARRKVTQQILKKVYEKSQLLVCQSQTVADYYNNVPNRVVIPNPINPTLIPNRENIDGNKVVAVGRLDKQKNYSMLLDAFAQVLMTKPSAYLQIYGEGPLRESLQKKIDLLHIGKSVKLCGAKREVLKYISNAAVFAMSSDYEGMPNALLEAMAIGLPVVCTDFATGVAYELIGENNGFVVPVGDSDAMAKAIIDILEHPERQSVICAQSRKDTTRFYNDKIMNRWLETFENV